MLFKTPSPTYYAPVTYYQLAENGEVDEIKFDAQFKRLKASVVKNMFSLSVKDRIDDREVLSRYMVGWRTVQSPDGTAAPFTPAALDELLEENAGMLAALAGAWLSSVQTPAAAHLAAKN